MAIENVFLRPTERLILPVVFFYFTRNKSLIITEDMSKPALAGTKDILLGVRVFTTGSSSEYTTVRFFTPRFLS